MSNPYPFPKGRPHPDHAAILEAAQVLASAAGSTRNAVIVVGPFGEPQIYDLSSSSESGSSNGTSPRRLSRDDLSQTGTPTRVAGKAEALIGSPQVDTDWVEYGAPVAGLEDAMELVSVDSDSGESIVPLTTPIDTPIQDEDTDWTALRLQMLQLERSKRAPLRVQTRPFAQERLIPIELPIEFRGPPVIVPQPAPQILRPITPPSSSSFNSGSTLVANEWDHNGKPIITVKDTVPVPSLVDEGYVCTACDATSRRMFHLLPCGDLACPTCFSSSVAAVSVTQGVSKCPACLAAVTSFDQYKPTAGRPHARNTRRKKRVELATGTPGSTVVMRIDNVAWDIEPHIVEDFLPANSLPPSHPQPVHICLDRLDGRTKDYLYIEVASTVAARRVLQQRQNAFMSGGRVTNGRRRAVTISIVTHDELLKELRPGSKNELLSLLELCEATLTTPPPQLRLDTSGRGRLHASVGQNGKVHYIKYRHAPFHALMSIMCKLRGRDSPAYWDIFRVASGAIAALASCIKSKDARAHPTDRIVLARLIALFDSCFGQATRFIQP